MKKSDLKDGMIVEYRDGRMKIVDGDDLLDANFVKNHSIEHYNNDLKRKDEECGRFDIVKAFELNQIWQREEPKEPTADDIRTMDAIHWLYGYKWYAKDLDGKVYSYKNKPNKSIHSWNAQVHLVRVFKDLSHLSWEDEEPYEYVPND